MKKILLVVVLTLILFMSGCGLDGSDIVNEGDIIIEYDGEPVYTQEEVDLMLEELYDFYIEENEQDIAELILRIEALENNVNINYYTTLMFNDKIEALENQDIETNITYATIAMLDVLIYMYDEELANGTVFTEEEVLYYDMLEMMRVEYVNALENGGE